MLILNTGNIELKMDFFDVLFLLNSNDRYRYIAEIDRLNEDKMFTIGLYDFKVQTINGKVNDKIPSEEVRHAIETHNVVMRLLNDENGNHIYIFDSINPAIDIIEFWQRVHHFMLKASEYNLELIKRDTAKLMALKKEGYEEGVLENQKLTEILNKYIATAEEAYKRFERKKAPLISVRPLPVKHYRKLVERYGILVTIDDKQVPIFFKDVDQKMLYIAAIARHKMGVPLYLHELFNNSRGRGNRTGEEKKKFNKWIKKIYHTIINMDREAADTWLTKIKEASLIQTKNNPLYQAKSDANRCIRAALMIHPTAQSFCLIHTRSDVHHDTYYTFCCPAEHIHLDDDLQRIMDEYIAQNE